MTTAFRFDASIQSNMLKQMIVIGKARACRQALARLMPKNRSSAEPRRSR
ncbi:hypothetical protein [Rhodopseudomonas palustris]